MLVEGTGKVLAGLFQDVVLIIKEDFAKTQRCMLECGMASIYILDPDDSACYNPTTFGRFVGLTLSKGRNGIREFLYLVSNSSNVLLLLLV